jgi:Arc/MetJ-type ribon-helix-helix transcriptional regulator
MTITIELPPEVEQWVARELEAGRYACAADFVNARLLQDWLEERIEESLTEPAKQLTEQDWIEARRRLEKAISNEP